MEPADARLSASIITSSSIRLSFTGEQVGWITYTSTPRTFSWISTKHSPSEKREARQRPTGSCRYSAMAAASSVFALPENTQVDLNIRSSRKAPKQQGLDERGVAMRPVEVNARCQERSLAGPRIGRDPLVDGQAIAPTGSPKR